MSFMQWPVWRFSVQSGSLATIYSFSVWTRVQQGSQTLSFDASYQTLDDGDYDTQYVKQIPLEDCAVACELNAYKITTKLTSFSFERF